MRGFFMAKSIIKVVYLKWFGKGLATLIKKVCNILLTIQLQTFKVPFTIELSNLFIQDLKKLSHAYKLLTKNKQF